jgi:hypothetical protein
MSWFDRITYPGVRLFAQVIAANRLEMKVTGLAHVPEYGPAVLVARHYHHLFDGVALFLSIPRPIHILVTLDWTKSTHVRRLMKRATTLARRVAQRKSTPILITIRKGVHSGMGTSTAINAERYVILWSFSLKVAS